LTHSRRLGFDDDLRLGPGGGDGGGEGGSDGGCAAAAVVVHVLRGTPVDGHGAIDIGSVPGSS
jgi:hypothetical protein